MKHTVSAVLVNYNHCKYLPRAIEQHLIQKDFFLELIIVDDGSTDKSVDIIKKYAEKFNFIKVIFHTKNKGISEAIATAVDKAKGTYVHLGAVDDIVEPNFFEKSMKIIENYPNAGFVFSDAGEFVEKTENYEKFPFWFSSKSRYFSALEMKKLIKKSYFTFPSLSCIFHKKKLLEVGSFRSDLERNGDLFAIFLLALRYGACYVPEILTWFCVRDDSYSSIGLCNKKSQKRTFYKTLDVLKNEYPTDYKNFRESGIVYEVSFRALWWLLSSKRYRNYITPLLLKRLIIRGFWRSFKKILPLSVRQLIRKIRGGISVKNI